MYNVQQYLKILSRGTGAHFLPTNKSWLFSFNSLICCKYLSSTSWFLCKVVDERATSLGSLAIAALSPLFTGYLHFPYKWLKSISYSLLYWVRFSYAVSFRTTCRNHNKPFETSRWRAPDCPDLYRELLYFSTTKLS